MDGTLYEWKIIGERDLKEIVFRMEINLEIFVSFFLLFLRAISLSEVVDDILPVVINFFYYQAYFLGHLTFSVHDHLHH